jgi:hypothetical protein
VLAHPQLQTLRRFFLATLDAHGLYAQFGFVPLTQVERFMEIRPANPYPLKPGQAEAKSV